jgi:hypothetical protein
MEEENSCPYRGFCENLKRPSKEYDWKNFENCPTYKTINECRKIVRKEASLLEKQVLKNIN